MTRYPHTNAEITPIPTAGQISIDWLILFIAKITNKGMKKFAIKAYILFFKNMVVSFILIFIILDFLHIPKVVQNSLYVVI